MTRAGECRSQCLGTHRWGNPVSRRNHALIGWSMTRLRDSEAKRVATRVVVAGFSYRGNVMRPDGLELASQCCQPRL